MIAVAGINHSSAGFSRFSGFSSAFRAADSRSSLVSGQVWLHTCNRIEIYADLRLHCKKSAENYLLTLFGLEDKPEGFFVYLEDEAVLHLLKVASGLASAVTGEDQILHQVKKAFQHALEQQTSSPLLNKLFHKAFETGKEVRSVTAVNKGLCSVAAIAASLADSFAHENLAEKKPSILIIGAGDTGALVAEILVKKGLNNIRIWNRTTEKALQVASALGVSAALHPNPRKEYLQADITIVAVNKNEPLINYHFPVQCSAKPRLVLDLCLPFQVPLSVQQEHCKLYNLASISTLKSEQEQKRKLAIEDASSIILAKLEEWRQWLDQQWMGQALDQWRIVFEEIHQRELKQFLKKYPNSNADCLNEFGTQLSATFLKQLAWTMRQQEHKSEEWKQWTEFAYSPESEFLN